MKTIWSNQTFLPEVQAKLQTVLTSMGWRWVQSAGSSANVLQAGQPDLALGEADVAYGQPACAEVMKYPGLRWVALSTAGYTNYDREDFRAAMQARGTVVTNASGVFADPCAQQVLAGMLALARNLPIQLRNQDGARAWRYFEDRATARVLTGETVLMLGFGTIGRRLAALLAPFGCRVLAYRRQARGDEGVEVISESGLADALAVADHVVNILPDSPATRGFMEASRFARMKPGARFYNIGRGTTVNQDALIAALTAGQVGGAYLDVMDPEPLPPTHPLWAAPNCFITCHIGGGTGAQDTHLAEHFLNNLKRFEQGLPLVDRVM